MRVTNNTHLPKHIASVLEGAWRASEYGGPALTATRTISVTRLIAPAQKVNLERLHDAELSVDVADTVPALLGQALHHVLERAGESVPTVIPERRLTVQHDGWTISGGQDLFETEGQVILDYKTSSVWAYIFGKIEWEQQLNVYRWLAERNGIPVKGLAVVLFCTDWRRSEARKNPDYPARVVHIPIKLRTMDETTAYVDARLKAHREAQEGNAAPCTSEERWAKPDTWAVMKKGQKRAVSVHTLEETAKVAMASGNSVEHRPGESTRCASYCAASTVCPQRKKELEAALQEEITA